MLRLIALFIFCSPSLITAQTKSFTVKFTDEVIINDGILNEESWQTADSASNFWEYFPSDSIQAKQQADIKMLFDDYNLYVGIKVNSPGEDYVIPSLRRDFRAGGSDNITLLFDTFHDGTNAIIFGTNPYGVKREMLLSGGGADVDDFDEAWDTKWLSETIRHEGYYIIEWTIPLSAFKYKEGETRWRFNSYHFDTQDNENNTWINIPQNQNIYNLAYMGDMIFEKPLGKSKSPISIIPYISAGLGKDYELDTENSDFSFGGDAKMTIGSSLNLDLTINPDFSQVEADRLVTNLTRFEISLPEQRQFFIENSDLFADFGDYRDANAFFSRRIGVAKNLDNEFVANDIIAGVRLSGKLTNKLRIGILDVQTEEDKANLIAATNNSVVTAQYKLFSRSNVSFMFINKQPTQLLDSMPVENLYNRVLGIDYRLASKSNTYIGKYYFHKSFSPESNNKDISAGASTEYNSFNYNLRLSGLYIGENFRSDLGFIRRTDIVKIDPKLTRNFWPENLLSINKSSVSIMPLFVWRPSLDMENSDYSIRSEWETKFVSSAELKFQMNNEFIKLYGDFDPTGSKDELPLPAFSSYYFSNFSASFRSDRRKTLSYRIEPGYGGFFNGKKFSFESSIDYRIQPFFAGSFQLNYDNINLPDPFPDAKIWLLSTKLDFTFTKNLFWATYIQYSTQAQNFGINSRLQWRFAQLSDLYLVYNDSYVTDQLFYPRVKTLNLKVTYWLNI